MSTTKKDTRGEISENIGIVSFEYGAGYALPFAAAVDLMKTLERADRVIFDYEQNIKTIKPLKQRNIELVVVNKKEFTAKKLELLITKDLPDEQDNNT